MNIVVTVAGAGQNTVLRDQSRRSCEAQRRAVSNSDSRQGKSAESLRVMCLDAIQPGSVQYEPILIRGTMGPHQCDALLLVTSIKSETPQRAVQKLRVPRHMLSHTMQQLHQNGIPVTSVCLMEAATSVTEVVTRMAMEPGDPAKTGQQSARRRRK